MRTVSSSNFATFLGILAILFSSAVFGVAGNLAKEVGALTAGGMAFIVGGTLGLIPLLLSSSRRRDLLSLSRPYFVICGGLFVAYEVFLYLAIAMTADSRQVIEVSILNYLWPTMTLLLSIPILKTRARPALALGLCAAFGGAALALGKGKGLDVGQFRQNIQANWPPYLLALMGAITWGLYSVMTRRLAAGSKGNAMPFFILTSGVLLMLLSAGRGEPRHWSARAMGELAFMTFVTALLTYVFWDIAMRRGRVVLVVALSYFTPILSLLLSSFYLKTPAGPSLWLGCLLVTVGAVICNYSLKEPATCA